MGCTSCWLIEGFPIVSQLQRTPRCTDARLMCGNLGRYLHFALYLKLPAMPVIGLLCLGTSVPSGSVSRTWIGERGVWFVRCLQIPSARVGPPCIPSHLLPYNRRCCPCLNVGQSHGHKTISCCNFDFHFLMNGS